VRVSQPVLGPILLLLHSIISGQLWVCRCGEHCLTRGRVRNDKDIGVGVEKTISSV
jgi:hypothetical protein